MEIKLNKKPLLFLSLFVTIHTYAQKSDEYYIKEVYVNSINMKSSHEDYRLIFEGKTVSDSIVWNDYDEENIRVVIFKGDSLYIYMSSYDDTTHLYSRYIKILSSRYEVKLRNMTFRVGMGLNSLKPFMPNIDRDYEKYIGKKKQYFSRPAYFGRQMMLETKYLDTPFYPCQGLKFQIKEGVVISILVDFRTDGDL